MSTQTKYVIILEEDDDSSEYNIRIIEKVFNSPGEAQALTHFNVRMTTNITRYEKEFYKKKIPEPIYIPTDKPYPAKIYKLTRRA